jgi:HTH-type transcriptional regulator, sugar sensing transcriptional regulator
MDLNRLLEQIGLTKREALVYLCLLTGGPFSPTDIAKETGLKRPNIYDVIKSLESKGLIHYQFKGGFRLIAASSPQSLLEATKTKFEIAKKVVPKLEGLHKEKGFQSSITFYQGKKAMHSILSDYPKAKSKEAWFLTSPQDLNKMLGEKFVRKLITERLKRKVKIRSLRPVEKDIDYEEQTKTDYGRELTEVAYIPPKYTFSLSMGVYDNKTVFFSSKKEGFGFKVESQEVAEVIRMLYDIAWKNSGKLSSSGDF